MGLFATIKKSIYDPDFYRGLAGRPFSFSLKYFLLLSIVLALVLTVWFSFFAVPLTQAFLARIGPAIAASYPDNLVLTLQGGSVSVNQPEPYALPVPEDWRGFFGEGGKRVPANLLVVNTKAPFSIEAFNGYDTAVLLTKNHLTFRSDSGKIEIQDLSGVPNVVMDKAKVTTALDKIGLLARYVAPAVVFVIFFAVFFVLTGRLVSLLLGALLILLVAKMRGVSLGYKKAYQAGMHLITLPVLVSAFQALVFQKTPFLFTILLLVMAWVNLKPEASAQ